MATTETGPALLKEFRKAHGLSAHAASAALGVTHVTLLSWEKGRVRGKVPRPDMRGRIERWTDGFVPASSWPLRPKEAREVRKSEAIEPFRTGTDG